MRSIFDSRRTTGQDERMKIYTRQGDQGKTRLVGGTTVPKNHLRVEAYGTVDEINALLGLIHKKSTLHSAKLQKISTSILRIQSELFIVGGALACEDLTTLHQLPALQQSHIDFLEREIDEMTLELPPLKNFILPGGNEIASLLHIARTVTRRAERNCVHLISSLPENLSELDIYIKYLNRLSDHLFTCARWCNKTLGQPDQLWSRS